MARRHYGDKGTTKISYLQIFHQIISKMIDSSINLSTTEHFFACDIVELWCVFWRNPFLGMCQPLQDANLNNKERCDLHIANRIDLTLNLLTFCSG